MKDVTLRLVHVEHDSMIELRVEGEKVRRIFYQDRIHKYQSTSDFNRMNTELQTYGIGAMMEEWNRLDV